MRPAVGPSAAIETLDLARETAELRDRAVETLARAFRDNPLNRRVVGGSLERRLQANRHGLRALIGSAGVRALALAAMPKEGEQSVSMPIDGMTGLLVAIPPFGYPLPGPSLGAQLRVVLGQGWGVARRWGRVSEALDRIHPQEPHWYLAILGVDPAVQGQGQGSALLATWLCRVDADEAAAYLETDRFENVSFYRRVGFEVVRETQVLGISIWCMWRPRPNSPSFGSAL